MWDRGESFTNVNIFIPKKGSNVSSNAAFLVVSCHL